MRICETMHYRVSIDYILYKYNMVLREVVKIPGPDVLDAWGYLPTRTEWSSGTPRDKEFLLLLQINRVVFVLLYLINSLLINKLRMLDSEDKIYRIIAEH